MSNSLLHNASISNPLRNFHNSNIRNTSHSSLLATGEAITGSSTSSYVENSWKKQLEYEQQFLRNQINQQMSMVQKLRDEV